MKEQEERTISRRKLIKTAGVAALGLVYIKPTLEIIRPDPALAHINLNGSGESTESGSQDRSGSGSKDKSESDSKDNSEKKPKKKERGL